MLLRVYFTSRPRVHGDGRICVTVCVTDEMGDPCPIPCTVHVEVLAGAEARPLTPEDGWTWSDAGPLLNDAWHTKLEGTLPRELAGQSVQLRVAAWPTPECFEDGGWEPWQLGCLACVSAPFCAPTAAAAAASAADATAAPAAAAPTADAATGNFCFRHFWFQGQLIQIREALDACDLTTGGHVWDAGIALADLLANCYAGASRAEDGLGSLVGKSFVELGCGCGLPGITASKVLGGRAVLTDFDRVLHLASDNVATNGLAAADETVPVAGADAGAGAAVVADRGADAGAGAGVRAGRVAVATLDWASAEQRQRILSEHNGGAPFDVVLMADTLYAPAVFDRLRDTVLGLTSIGSVVFIAQKFRGEDWHRLASKAAPSADDGEEAEGAGDCRERPSLADGERGFVQPLRRLLRKWFDLRLVLGDRDSPSGVFLLELRRIA